jgi:hypothetical protein
MKYETELRSIQQHSVVRTTFPPWTGCPLDEKTIVSHLTSTVGGGGCFLIAFELRQGYNCNYAGIEFIHFA